jgi:hypothetical protein
LLSKPPPPRGRVRAADKDADELVAVAIVAALVVLMHSLLSIAVANDDDSVAAATAADDDDAVFVKIKLLLATVFAAFLGRLRRLSLFRPLLADRPAAQHARGACRNLPEQRRSKVQP